MALAQRSLAGRVVRSTAPKLRTVRVSRSSDVRVSARAGNWLPGSDAPSWIPEDQPGNFGFDPMGLAKEKPALERFTEAELIHCRWAMLGAAGVLAVEVLGFGNWYDAPLQALDGGKSTYFGAVMPLDLKSLAIVEVVAFAVSESLRGGEPDAEKRKYPGGAFDPLGLSKDPSKMPELKLKEIKNGRLAMVALLGFVAQHAATGKAPIEALKEHLSSPWAANCGTNGVSIPGF